MNWANYIDSTATFNTNCSNAIDDISFENLYVHPIPVKNWLHIDTNDVLSRIKLFDISGKLIKKFEAKDRNLDLTLLKKGIYILKLSNQTKQSIVKIIKE
jgi:hypothetical protein